jgi:hypothetical protein
MTSAVKKGCCRISDLPVVFAIGMILLWPSVGLARQTPEGFGQDWLLLGPYTRDVGGADPGDAVIRRDYLTNGGSTTETSLVPTIGAVVSTNYAVAASSGFVTDNPFNNHAVPTVFYYMSPVATVDCAVVFGQENADTMVYAWTTANNKTGGPLVCYVGASSDDSIQVKINGVEVGINNVLRDYGGPIEVQDVYGPVVLQPGNNLVMVKVFNGGGGFGFRLRFQTNATRGQGRTANAIPESQLSLGGVPASAIREINSVGIYYVGVPIPVHVSVNKAFGTISPQVVEQPPAGWPIAGITTTIGSAPQSGGKITWTLGSMTTDTAVMSYTITPNVLAGERTSSGTLRYGTSAFPVYGDNALVAQSALGLFDWHGNIGVEPVGHTSGDPSTSGSSTLVGGVYTLTGSGTDVWDPLDRCQIVVKPMTGSFYIEALVDFYSPGSSDWATAALGVRSKMAPTAAWGAIALRNPVTVTGGDIMGFEWRERNGGTCGGTNVEMVTTQPRAMRLVRQGSTVHGYFKSNSGAWIEQVESPHDVPDLADEVLASMFVTSQNNGHDASARFSNVVIAPTAVGSVTRDIQATSYTVGHPIHVVLDIRRQANSIPLIVKEVVPAGWTASGISDGGVQTGTTITWGLSFTANKLLSYDITPTSGIVPEYFVGFTRDAVGIDTPVGGDTTILAAGATIFQHGAYPDPTYAGTADVHVLMWADPDPPGTHNTGANDMIEEGDWDGGTGDNRLILVRFELSGVIGYGAIVEEAWLCLHYGAQRRSDATLTNHWLYARMIAKDWSEGGGDGFEGRLATFGEVSWNSARTGIQNWEVRGLRGLTDLNQRFVARSSAQFGTVSGVWVEFNVTDFVRYWAADPGSNHGFKISQDEVSTGTVTGYVQGVYDFESHENWQEQLRPMLVVKWKVNPASRADHWSLYP